MASNIGGPKIIGSIDTIKQITIKAGGSADIQIYNNTQDALNWSIASPLPGPQWPQWLIITPSIGNLKPKGQPGSQETVTVEVAKEGPFVPNSVKVVFGWDPANHPKSADTLEVTVTQ